METMRRVVVSLCLASCLCLAGAQDLKWWQSGVVYQIYPRSFKDSDGDGVGDLKGIISKVDYLHQLGVSAVWLSPVYKSPMVDLGYDVSNFYEIDPLFGTMEDFDTLRQRLHDLGMRLVMDFVVSYSSDQIDWFPRSAAREPGYEDWYVWAVGEANASAPHGYDYPSNWLSLFRGPAWEWNEQRQEFFYHAFTDKQPDLNYRSSGLVNAMEDVLRFWLDKGVDGFRVDAVSQMFEDEQFRDESPSGNSNDTEDSNYLTHVYTQNRPETYDMVKQWRAILDEYESISGNPKAMMLEVYDVPEVVMPYYGDAQRPGAHFPFNFFLVTGLKNSSTAQDLDAIVHSWMDNMPDGNWPNWVLGNHDQPRVGSRLGRELVDAVNMLSLLLPGTAITFMGEELGMENTFVSWEETVDPWALNAGPDKYLLYTRDPERTPFQWDSTDNAGFSAPGVHTWLPVNPNYLQGVNVADQEVLERSHLKVYRRLVALRSWSVTQTGALQTAVLSPQAFAFSRALQGHPTVIVVINLGDEFETLDLAAAFPNLPDQLIVYESSGFSQLYGSVVSSRSVVLEPKAGAVLLAD